MKNKQRVTLRLWTVALGLAVLVGFGGNVYALTPDGETPANEGVCDVLQGGTPGLYGLCVAYCEAQDLDIVGDKETPNNKILANYKKKMRDGDPEMPCIPCWSAAELAAITNNAAAGDSVSCIISHESGTAQIRNATRLQFATINIGRSPALCRFTDGTQLPQISRRVTIDSTVSGDPAATGQSLFDQVVSACQSLGY